MMDSVEGYLEQGCMRCSLGGTPQCKVHRWRNELVALRALLLECGLTEESKWGMPCYTINGKNVIMLSAYKEFACLSFFKGSLLQDTFELLVKPGEHSQASRYLKFTDTSEIQTQIMAVKDYIFQAIEIEKAGKEVSFKKNPEPMPVELEQVFELDEALETAFFALTPGRQRGYIIYFSQPKQSQSRFNRIEKCREKILNGEGLTDKYSSKKSK
jgi:uncharacterized protein YdeI (YjbR/CyaY-like superfamily)